MSRGPAQLHPEGKRALDRFEKRIRDLVEDDPPNAMECLPLTSSNGMDKYGVEIRVPPSAERDRFIRQLNKERGR